jgi:hypothetical protein
MAAAPSKTTATCAPCEISFPVARHGLACPVCGCNAVDPLGLLADAFADHPADHPADEPVTILLELPPRGESTVHLSSWGDLVSAVANSMTNHVSHGRHTSVVPVVVPPGRVLTATKQHGNELAVRCSMPCAYRTIRGSHKYVTLEGRNDYHHHVFPIDQYVGLSPVTVPEPRERCNVACPLPVRYGFIHSTAETPGCDFIRDLGTFVRRISAILRAPRERGSELFMNKHGVTSPTCPPDQLLDLLYNNMFMAALDPQLKDVVSWNIHRLFDFSPGKSTLWLLLRILPGSIPVIGLECPQLLSPDEFEPVPELPFMRVYTGKNEACHMMACARIADALMRAESQPPDAADPGLPGSPPAYTAGQPGEDK